MNEAAPDWASFLGDELDRIERFQAFLWAALLAIIAAFVFTLSKVFDLTEASTTGIFLGILSGGLSYLVVGRPLVNQLIAVAGPIGARRWRPVQALAFVRALERWGQPNAQRAANAADAIAVALVGVALVRLASLLESPFGEGSLRVAGYLLIVNYIFVVITARTPRKMTASVIAWNLDELYAAAPESPPVTEADRKALAALREMQGRSWIPKNVKQVFSTRTLVATSSGMDLGLKAIVWVAVAVIGIVLVSQVPLPGVIGDAADAAPRLASPDALAILLVALSVNLAFIGLRLVVRFLMDDSRRVLGEIRFAAFAGTLTMAEASLAYEIANTLQTAGIARAPAPRDLIELAST